MTEPPTTATQPASLDATELVERYRSGWNETDPQRRRDIIEHAWEPDCRLVTGFFQPNDAVA